MLVHQNTILVFSLATFAVWRCVMNLRFAPEYLRTAHSAFLPISPVDDLPIKATKRAFRVLWGEVSEKGQYTLRVIVMTSPNVVGTVRA